MQGRFLSPVVHGRALGYVKGPNRLNTNPFKFNTSIQLNFPSILHFEVFVVIFRRTCRMSSLPAYEEPCNGPIISTQKDEKFELNKVVQDDAVFGEVVEGGPNYRAVCNP